MSLPILGASETHQDYVAGAVANLKTRTIAVQDTLPRALMVGSPVYVVDVISTGANIRIKIRMIDDGVLTLGERTLFVIFDYVF